MNYEVLIPTVKLRVEKRQQHVHKPVVGSPGYGSLETVLVDCLQQWWSVTGLYNDERGEWINVPIVYNNTQPQWKPHEQI